MRSRMFSFILAAASGSRPGPRPRRRSRRSRPTSTRPSPRGWLRFWSSFLASNMQPVFATECQATHRILAEVLINFDATVSRD